MATTKTFTEIARSIARSSKQLNERLDFLAREAISAANKAAKSETPDNKAALDKAVIDLHTSIGKELTDAFRTLKAECGEAAEAAKESPETAALWDWHSGKEARRYRNAIGYIVRCTAQKTGLAIAFDRQADCYTVAIATPKNTAKATSAKPSTPESDGSTIAAMQAAENAANVESEKTAKAIADDEARTLAIIDKAIANDRQALLLALAATFPDRDSMLDAVAALEVGAFGTGKIQGLVTPAKAA